MEKTYEFRISIENAELFLSEKDCRRNKREKGESNDTGSKYYT